jgi:hypothetical protein
MSMLSARGRQIYPGGFCGDPLSSDPLGTSLIVLLAGAGHQEMVRYLIA